MISYRPRSAFRNRFVAVVRPDGAIDFFTIPDDEPIRCDLCNAEIPDDPVAVLDEMYAVCAECLAAMRAE